MRFTTGRRVSLLTILSLGLAAVACTAGTSQPSPSQSSTPPATQSATPITTETPTEAATVAPTQTTRATEPPATTAAPPTLAGPCVIEAGSIDKPALTEGRCEVPTFVPPFSFEAPGWGWSMSAAGDRLTLVREVDGRVESVGFYRYGGAVIDDPCTDPPATTPMSDVNGVWEWLEDRPELEILVIGRSVGPDPAWQFDLRTANPQGCSGDAEPTAALWTIEAAEPPAAEALAGDERMTAYFILAHYTDVVVMAARASVPGGTAPAPYSQDFQFAIEEILSSLSFGD